MIDCDAHNLDKMVLKLMIEFSGHTGSNLNMKSNIPPKGCISRSACKFQQNGQTRKPVRSVLPHVYAPRPEHSKALEALLTEAQVQERELLEIIKINPLDEKLKELDRMQYFIRQLNIQIAARGSK